jgi:glycosyltransferase involved in cell wall biosynthesis
MRIAINTRFLLPGKMEGFGWYTYEISKRLVQNHPEHQFYFFFDRPYDKQFIFAKNVTPVILNPPARHPFLFVIWYEFSVRRALRKHKIDLFFSPDGYLSLGSSVPQIPVIHDINFVHNPNDLKPLMSKYYRYFFPKFAKKAKKIITVSQFSKQDICQNYGITEDAVVAIWNGCSEVFQPIRDETKKITRDKYSRNKPFILFVGALHPRKNLKRLMLAFAELKNEEPECPHQLLIVGAELWKNGLEDVEIDKAVKSQIHFTGHLDMLELAKVVASAEFLAFVPYFEGFGIPLVEAMRCGTPILAGDKTALPEVAGNAAIYCDPFSVESIRAGLHLLIHDNDLRENLSKNGLERSLLFSWDISAEQVWKVIESELQKTN